MCKIFPSWCKTFGQRRQYLRNMTPTEGERRATIYAILVASCVVGWSILFFLARQS